MEAIEVIEAIHRLEFPNHIDVADDIYFDGYSYE